MFAKYPYHIFFHKDSLASLYCKDHHKIPYQYFVPIHHTGGFHYFNHIVFVTEWGSLLWSVNTLGLNILVNIWTIIFLIYFVEWNYKSLFKSHWGLYLRIHNFSSGFRLVLLSHHVTSTTPSQSLTLTLTSWHQCYELYFPSLKALP